MRRVRKWLLRIFATLAITAVFLLGLVAIVLNTEFGSRFVIHRAVAAIPGDANIHDIEGTLWRGLTFARFDYRDTYRSVVVQDVSLVIDWPSVTLGRIAIQSLAAGSAEYRDSTPADPEPGPLEIEMAPLPVAIEAGSVEVGSFLLTIGVSGTQIDDISIERADVDGQRIRVGRIEAHLDQLAIEAERVNTTLSGDVPLRANVAWATDNGEWSGQGDFEGTLAELGFDHGVSGDYAATANGVLRLLHRIEPEFDARVTWTRWVFGEIAVEDGSLQVAGNTANYTADGSVDVLLPGERRIRIEGSASGDAERLDAIDVAVSGPEGTAEVVGSLAWSPGLSGDAAIRFSNFDPSTFVAELSGSLQGTANVQLVSGEDIRISNAVVSGVLNEAALDAVGHFDWSPAEMRCRGCRVTSGGNQVEFDGRYGADAIDATLAIAAPELASLWPAWQGALQGRGRIDGSVQQPRFVGELRGAGLAIEGWSVAELSLISRTASADRLDISATVRELAQAESDYGSGTALIGGTLSRQDVIIEWNYGELYTRLAGSVARDEAAVSGVLDSVLFVEPRTGEWSLNRPVSYRYDSAGLNVAAHRWTGSNGEVEVSALMASAASVDIDARASGLPLNLVNLYLPEGYRIDGDAEVVVDVSRAADNWTGMVRWEQRDSRLTVPERGGQSIPVVIPSLLIESQLVDGGARTTANILIEPGVRGDVRFVLDRLDAEARIDGDMTLRGEDWAWVTSIVPTIDNFDGVIAADVHASGAVIAPAFDGSLTWRNGSLDVPAMNVPMRDIDVVIAGASAGSATLEGRARAGDGVLAVRGRFEELMREERSLQLTISGESAQLLDWPGYRIWGSPDLTIRGDSSGWNFDGQLAVPRAEFVIEELPETAVEPSPDVIVAGEDSEETSPTVYAGEARLVLGDQVRVQAFGLDTRLAGELVVRKTRERPLTAEGEVSLVDGVFVAYGQRLRIQSGTLTFTGPLDDPIVNVRAIREVEDFDGTITAGIQLRGRASNISSSLFSQPAMSEADTLSYLVLGRPLEQASDAEGSDLSNAAVALGLRQTGRLTQQIGETLGLDQLSFAGDGGNATALVAGKQVNKRLYARYAYGVFSQLGSLLLRYRLSQRLTLEAGAGEVQSIDVLYTVEKE